MAEGGDRPVVVVIGGGISGLAASRLVAGLEPASGERPAIDHTARVVLLEASGRLGGKLAAGELAGQPVELGPDQFLRRDPSAERLCRLVGLGDALVAPGAAAAAVYSRGGLRTLPAGLALGVPTDLAALEASGIVSPEGVERARRDAEPAERPYDRVEVGLDPGDGERSAGAIFRERLGDEVVDRLVDPLLGGINAGSVDTLSLGVTAPQLAAALVGRREVTSALAATVPPRPGPDAPRPPSPFFGLAGGLAQLPAALGAELAAAGVEVRIDTPVEAVERDVERDGERYRVVTAAGSLEADGIVLALPAFAAARVVAPLSDGLAGELAQIPYASVAVATFAFPTARLVLPPGITGCLVPRVEGRLMTAATFLSAKWPWMAGGDLAFVRVSAGRYRDERPGELADDELAARLGRELREVVEIDLDPVASSITRWDRALPQYLPGHRVRMARVETELARHERVELAGALLGGVGIPACVTSGEAAARRLAEHLPR